MPDSAAIRSVAPGPLCVSVLLTPRILYAVHDFITNLHAKVVSTQRDRRILLCDLCALCGESLLIGCGSAALCLCNSNTSIRCSMHGSDV